VIRGSDNLGPLMAATALTGAVRATRPRQWVKNILVLAAPVAAGRLFEPGVLVPTLLAVVAFCLVASAVYLLNDVSDVDEDRRHPVKQHRPIAAGLISPRLATLLAVAAGLAGLVLGFAIRFELGLTLVVYVALQVAYSWWLKHQPVLDLACVAAGFLLRAVAGGAATGIPLSQWFLLVASFGSLFMVSGKRYSEMRSLGADAGTRRALEGYTVGYLRFVWGLSTAVTLMTYSLWAFEMDPPGDSGVPWNPISIAPFVLGTLRYAVHIDAGEAGEPEDIVLHDRVLQGLGVIWLATVCAGVFGA
jgi:decaprenyl-phosphate phosphoribosyltransferase